MNLCQLFSDLCLSSCAAVDFGAALTTPGLGTSLAGMEETDIEGGKSDITQYTSGTKAIIAAEEREYFARLD